MATISPVSWKREWEQFSSKNRIIKKRSHISRFDPVSNLEMIKHSYLILNMEGGGWIHEPDFHSVKICVIYLL